MRETIDVGAVIHERDALLAVCADVVTKWSSKAMAYHAHQCHQASWANCFVPTCRDDREALSALADRALASQGEQTGEGE